MAPTSDIARAIRQLADPDLAKRAAAARQLRAVALDRCFGQTNDWIRDPEFLRFTTAPAAEGRDWQRVSFVVGIAVQPETFERIHQANGSPELADVPPEQDAIEFELHFELAGEFDILTSRDPRGPGAIARYLEKFGEGIQQVEVNVTDIDRASRLLRTRFGLASIYPTTQPGADRTRVNFFLVPAAGHTKCLIELVEKPL
jgi:hypothetical protein